MNGPSQVEPKQPEKKQESEDAKAETDKDDTARTSTLKLEKELWPNENPSGPGEENKKKK